MDRDHSSRRLRKRAEAERRWQVILRAALIGAYCVILVVAGIYLGISSRERRDPVSAPVTDNSQGEGSSTARPGSGDGIQSEGGSNPVYGASGDSTATQTSAGQQLTSDNGKSSAAGADSGDGPTVGDGEIAGSEEAASDVASSSGPSGDAEPAAVLDTPSPAETPELPVSGEVVAGPRWVFSDVLNEWRFIPGMEISAQPGSAVTASLSGTVVSVEDDPLLGTIVILKHDDGLVTEYGRLSACMLGVGDTVKQGDEIGRAGGASVYFSASRDGETVSLDFTR